MHLTAKQIELLTLINRANPDGVLIDLDQLLERASYKPSKQSIQFSIRALIAHELIEKAGAENRRGRSRVLFRITSLGQHFVATPGAAAIVSPVNEEDIITSIEELMG